MNIILKAISLENFKGITNKTIRFKSDITNILGANGSGKTTVFDSLTWLLFDKDSSYSNKFQLRPLDKEGNLIHHVEIRVRADFEIDGKPVSIAKVQKENWVKHRGNDNAILEGNVNTYFIDDIGKSEKDFKGFVGTLVDEDLFKILTNPLYFTSLNWKEQREAIMRLVVDFTDLDFAKSDEKYSLLVPYFDSITNPSTEDLRKTFSNAINGYKKKQKEIPVRVDELSKQKVELDFAELELSKKDLESRLADLELKSKAGVVDISDLITKRYEIETELRTFESQKAIELEKHRAEVRRATDDTKSKLTVLERELREYKEVVEKAKENLQKCENDKPNLNKRFIENRDKVFNESEWVFDESSTICSLCGQKLPADKISSLQTEFETKKARAKEAFNVRRSQEKEEINRDVDNLKKKIAEYESIILNTESNISEVEGMLSNVSKQYEEYSRKLLEIPSKVDVSIYPEYVSKTDELETIKKQIEEANNNNTEDIYKAQIQELKEQLNRVNIDLSKSANNVQIDERISDLNLELKEVSQKIADQEMLINALEEFIRDKMLKIADDVNSKFRMVQFKLFNVQINGGISETCECTYDGVPFNSLNSARKIQCGLDIIHTLSGEYDKYCPIFIDNRESCTEIPNMESQVINLYVAHKHKELTVME